MTSPRISANRAVGQKTMQGRQANRLTRLATIVAVMVALVLAQVIVNLTHAPVLSLEISEMDTHGHSHDHWDEEEAQGEQGRELFPGHDATDHEHQLQALAVHPGTVETRAAKQASHTPGTDLMPLNRDGLRRPPRFV